MTKEIQKEKKYITLENGIDYRTIAKIMTENNYQMNHATARNQLIQATEKFVSGIVEQFSELDLSSDDISALLKDRQIHQHLGDVLYSALELNKKQIENKEAFDSNGENSNEK